MCCLFFLPAVSFLLCSVAFKRLNAVCFPWDKNLGVRCEQLALGPARAVGRPALIPAEGWVWVAGRKLYGHLRWNTSSRPVENSSEDTLGLTSRPGSFCGMLHGRVLGRVGSVSCQVRGRQRRKRLDFAAGSSSPRAAPCQPPSRAGWVVEARARAAGGTPGLSSGRSPNLSAAKAGRQPLCPCLHPSCLAGVLERLGVLGKLPSPRVSSSARRRGFGGFCWTEADGDLCNAVFVVVSEVLLVWCIFSWVQSQILKTRLSAHAWKLRLSLF